MNTPLEVRKTVLASLCYVSSGPYTLMIHRNKKPGDIHAGKWNGLGGKFLPSESPEDCARREIREESGLEVQELIWKGCISFPHFTPGKDWYVFVYRAITDADRSAPLVDCPEGTLAWKETARLAELNLWPGDEIFLPWVFQDGIFSAEFIYDQGELRKHSVHFY